MLELCIIVSHISPAMPLPYTTMPTAESNATATTRGLKISDIKNFASAWNRRQARLGSRQEEAQGHETL